VIDGDDNVSYARRVRVAGSAGKGGKVSMLSSKRLFDLVLSLLLIVGLSPLFVIVAMIIKLTSKGPVFHWSRRVGKDNQLFLMPKFRSMRMDAPQLATHLLATPSEYLTPAGSCLRRTSVDELPQLFSIIAGRMSFVGPRPALFNQEDLIALRTERGVHCLAPGLTGWAQVNGRDELPTAAKVRFDYEYLQRQSFLFDLRVVGMTVKRVARGHGIHH